MYRPFSLIQLGDVILHEVYQRLRYRHMHGVDVRVVGVAVERRSSITSDLLHSRRFVLLRAAPLDSVDLVIEVHVDAMALREATQWPHGHHRGDQRCRGRLRQDAGALGPRPDARLVPQVLN